ncbi:RNA-binding single-stranded-interacting 3 [Brachionus plicatilis]|uniref:RNA-binding single-stranded-interacting 3 n=1 Tax=Brachionus plicatilis TaxID=10195 RepID=A0A3M7RX22_BRAPC|nr:RNA-binding single-stranded-interacting 3 [Brachionus plicatilis]
MYSAGQSVCVQEPTTPHVPSTSSTSISSSSASSSSYSLMPSANLLTPPSNGPMPGYKSNSAAAYNHKYFNGQGSGLYESKNQAVFFNTPNTTPNVYVPSLPYYLNNEMESSRMVPGSVSPSGSLSDITETSLNNSKSHFHYSKSDYYVTKREKLIPTSMSKTNLYIRGLAENTTDDDLYEMCKKFGEIKSTKAIIDKQNLKCKGYGFVDFKSLDDAKTALSELKKEQKDVQLAKQREQDPTNLYFANLPSDIDESVLASMLKSRFSANVSSTRIMRERSGASKGVGFARLDCNRLCDDIIQQLNNQPFPDHANQSKLISVKLADSGGIFKSKLKNSSDKENLNNTNNSSQANSYNSNDANNNYSQNNYNIGYPSSPSSYTLQSAHSYSPYMESSYQSAYPIVIENYQSGATIVSHNQPPQSQPLSHPVSSTHPYPQYHPHMHRQPIQPYLHSGVIPHQQSSTPPQFHSQLAPHFYSHHGPQMHPLPYYYYPPQTYVQLKPADAKAKHDSSSQMSHLSQQLNAMSVNSNLKDPAQTQA